MPLQNRVTPDSQIIAVRARGTLMGNRGGMIHRTDKTLGPKRWVTKQWITCRLSFKGRWREVMGPDGYTELFFLDEATSFAAGHRPCYECRRQEAIYFSELWGEALGDGGRAKAGDIDEVLHAERLNADGRKATFRARLGDLPTGAMVKRADGMHLVLVGRLLLWSPDGYVSASPIDPEEAVEVLTPRSLLEVFKAGYDADVHETALALV